MTCWVWLDDLNFIKTQTGELRTKPDALTQLLRTLLREKGINVDSSHLAKFFDDGPGIIYGIIVTEQRQVFDFDFDWYKEKKFLNWREARHKTHFEEDVVLALQLVAENESGVEQNS